MRTYGQYCGLARALEVVGDRWNLLIVRQLLLGPARYGDLADGLPGIATNMLADRLRDLESAGVVERRPAVAGSVIDYALTPWGAQLRGPIESLIRWSTPLMIRGPEGDVVRSEWLGLAVPALLDVRVKVRAAATIGLDVDRDPADAAAAGADGSGRDAQMQLRATRYGFEVGPRDGRRLDATLRADSMFVLGLAAGALSFSDAQALGVIEVEGDASVVQTVFGW